VDRHPETQDEWRELHEVVMTFAYKQTKSRVRTEELTHEAFARWMTTRKWNPATEPSLAKHLMKIVKSLISNEHTSKRGDYELQAGIEQSIVGRDAAPSAEAMSLEKGEAERKRWAAARRLQALREMLTGLELELQLIDLTAEGVDDRGEQAKATGRTRDQVYEAWRRIYRYMARVPEVRDDEEVA
jgi:DNA-directed RNA polymerase specialized sigma24 family protein